MTFQNLNRKIHIYLGLFFLLFIWLFSFTGLILNHGNWKVTSFWDEREEHINGFSISHDAITGDIVPSIMNHLGISGEARIQNQTSESLELRVESPGVVNDINMNLITGQGTWKEIKFNAWGKLRGLHTFNGVNPENKSSSPNWWITNLWRYSMDVIAIGLIIICFSSWIMWYKVRKEYKLGYVAIVLSFALAGYFVFLGLF